jgi:hypothetical protein
MFWLSDGVVVSAASLCADDHPGDMCARWQGSGRLLVLSKPLDHCPPAVLVLRSCSDIHVNKLRGKVAEVLLLLLLL